MKKDAVTTYRNINRIYAEYSVIKNFMSKTKGAQIAKRLNKEPIRTLLKRFDAPTTKIKDDIKLTSLYLSAARRHKLLNNNTTLNNYANKIKKAKKDGLLKLPKTLNKQELYELSHPYITDEHGNYIHKTDNRGRYLWNRDNKPIYKRKTDSSKRIIGLAEKCHLYELHKMAKWDKKHPKPTSKELCFTLFPEEAVNSYKTQRLIALENIRNQISETYYEKTIELPLLRTYIVHKSTGYMGKQLTFEQECDPYIYGYPFAGYNKEYPDINTMTEKLNELVKKARNMQSENIVGFRVYNKIGELISQRAA